MTLKKWMFRSNMKILFAALLSLMLVILAVLVLLEDSLETQMHEVGQTKLEEHVREVADFIDAENPQSAGELQKMVGRWKYRTAVIAGGKILSGDESAQMRNLAEYEIEEGTDGRTEIFTCQSATVVGKYLPDRDAFLVAAYFPESSWLSLILKRSFYSLLGAVLLAGCVTIVFLLLLASFFTRKMNQIIMEPLQKLVKGAERIKQGNLNERIEYHGETEFEHVCETFNDMQLTILEDQRQREKTERARRDMVTGISHDLRTPLTSIQGYMKGILDGVADTEEKRRAYLNTACESAEEMNLLLQRLFDFSRMESGQMPFHMANVDLLEYVTAYAAQKESTEDPAVLQIQLKKEKEYLPEISIDVEQVRRILDNLLENSRKYAHTIPVKITISVKEQKEWILLEWKDNGQGVSEQKMERIFEKFYRCDESRTEKGSGIGLYVVRYIMERHKGMVKAENEGGLKISLYFPRQK